MKDLHALAGCLAAKLNGHPFGESLCHLEVIR